MAVRQVVKIDNGYRMVGRKGLVWLVRADGSILYCSSWQPTCLAQSVGAQAALATLAAVDELGWGSYGGSDGESDERRRA